MKAVIMERMFSATNLNEGTRKGRVWDKPTGHGGCHSSCQENVGAMRKLNRITTVWWDGWQSAWLMQHTTKAPYMGLLPHRVNCLTRSDRHHPLLVDRQDHQPWRTQEVVPERTFASHLYFFIIKNGLNCIANIKNSHTLSCWLSWYFMEEISNQWN